jgi:AcrR family transcriptional regulator
MAKEKQIDSSTEEQVIAAAKKIFTQKGFEATKMRDIADEADINLSLINYYFRSKEKLFALIMTENINKLFEKVIPIFNNEQTDLYKKIELLCVHYIDLLRQNPDFALFIVNEVLSGNNEIKGFAAKKESIQQSVFAKQVFALKQKGKIKYHPLHILMNVMSMLLFPFLTQNTMGKTVGTDEFHNMMEERKVLIPIWIKAIISS